MTSQRNKQVDDLRGSFGTKLKESLLCPNQLRAAGNLVHDVLIQFDPSSSHSITVPGTLEIPLAMHGVISYLDTRAPMEEELEQYRAAEGHSMCAMQRALTKQSILRSPK